ncbi:MAG TPA: methylmalonyl-CoA mutase family protein [Acidimicrobiales bacterium]|nr:methylmalonyl-CoA mutase family protein [Acidimicrobiales bacterium]
MADSSPGDLALAAEFPRPTREQWRALVDGVLKGRPFEKVLVTTLYDGIDVQPLYTADDASVSDRALGLPGSEPYVRGSAPMREGWDVRQHHVVTDPAAANEAILGDLERGATSIWLRAEASDLAEALEGVYLNMAAVVLDSGPDFAAAARGLIALWADREIVPSAALGGFGADPIARGGDLAAAVELAALAHEQYAEVRAIVTDGTPYHDAGGSDVEELGCSMATGVAYLRALTSAGLDVAAAARQIEFRYAASADQFATIAKLRAARRLWARVTEACGAAQPQLQHAVTSSAMMTQRDPWVNLLRTTIAGFAAALGGADAITVQPFDAAIGVPDTFARRIARNTQALLHDEASLARVVDAAGGSWYVEALTDQLAREAWAWFQEIERGGGMVRALADGIVATRIDATWSARAANIARRKDAITGVSEFPNLRETPVSRPAPPPAQPSPLPSRRYAAAYEALRDRAESVTPRPRVFLANLGSPAVHTARAMFARNLFEAGGIEAVGDDGYDSPIASAGAFAASGARIACICSSDAMYEERADATAAALREEGAERVYLAGRRDTPGVDEHIYAGCDAIAVLTRALDALEAQRMGRRRRPVR